MRRLMLLLALLAAALAAPAAAQTATPPGVEGAAASPSAWKLFRYPELHLMFRAPADAQPRQTDKMTPSGGQMVPEHQLVVVDAGGWGWMISVGDFTSATGSLNIDGVPPGAAGGMGARIVGPVRTLAIAGAEAREYDAATDKMVMRSRVLLRDRRLYQSMAISEGSTLPPNTDAFLASVTPLP
jgi:hypothetical protein